VIVVYQDTTSDACTLSGYPTVIGVTAANGTEVTAHDGPAGELGGLGGRASKDRVPRAVVLHERGAVALHERGAVALHERGAVASALMEYASIGTLQTVSPRCIGVGLHPMGIDELRAVVDGGKPRGVRVVRAPTSLVVCNALSANSYVSEVKGRSNPTLPDHASGVQWAFTPKRRAGSRHHDAARTTARTAMTRLGRVAPRWRASYRRKFQPFTLAPNAGREASRLALGGPGSH
jgi:hypothetical protein